MGGQSSLHLYLQVKSFAKTPAAYALSHREEGLLGALTPEVYLDDHKERLGTKLKCLARANCLPLFSKISREMVDVPDSCPRCITLCPETLQHVLLHCPAYATLRSKLLAKVERSINTAQSPLAITLSTYDDEALTCLLLGKRIGDPTTERAIDVSVIRFL